MSDRQKIDELRSYIGISSNLIATLWKCVGQVRDGAPMDENYNEMNDQYSMLRKRLDGLERETA